MIYHLLKKFFYLRPLLNFFIKWIADCPFLSSEDTPFDKLVINGVLYKCTGACTAALSLIEKHSGMGILHCIVQITVSKHYVRALSSQLQCHTL